MFWTEHLLFPIVYYDCCWQAEITSESIFHPKEIELNFQGYLSWSRVRQNLPCFSLLCILYCWEPSVNNPSVEYEVPWVTWNIIIIMNALWITVTKTIEKTDRGSPNACAELDTTQSAKRAMRTTIGTKNILFWKILPGTLLFSLLLPRDCPEPRFVSSVFLLLTPTWQISKQFTSRPFEVMKIVVEKQSASYCHIVVETVEKYAADQVRHW